MSRVLDSDGFFSSRLQTWSAQSLESELNGLLGKLRETAGTGAMKALPWVNRYSKSVPPCSSGYVVSTPWVGLRGCEIPLMSFHVKSFVEFSGVFLLILFPTRATSAALYDNADVVSKLLSCRRLSKLLARYSPPQHAAGAQRS